MGHTIKREDAVSTQRMLLTKMIGGSMYKGLVILTVLTGLLFSSTSVFAALPGPATFTVTPTTNNVTHIANVAGSTNLFSDSGVRYYRTTFSLPSFSTISADIQLSVDNDVHIFINGAALALVVHFRKGVAYFRQPSSRVRGQRVYPLD